MLQVEKISYSETGGFAPVFISFELARSLLSEHERAEIDIKFAESGIAEHAGDYRGGGRDMRTFFISAEVNGESYKVSYNGVMPPARVLAFATFLKDVATRHGVSLD